MKNRIFLFLFLLLPLRAYAQSDSLVINFKDGKKVTIALSDIQKITFDSIKADVPVADKLFHNLIVSPSFPNPAAKNVTIDFSIATSGRVNISIYDSKGNPVRQLSSRSCPSGNNRIVWDGLDDKGVSVQNGAYFYEVRFKNEVQVRKMVMIK